MKTTIIPIFFVFIFGLTLTFGQDNSTLFDEAYKAYNEGNYQEAITKYKTIEDSGAYSAELYYNLANAYYKTNAIGPSVYYFEKALQLAPNDEDIQNNLAFAKNMTIDAIEPLPQNQISKFVDSITGKFTYNQWAWISVVLGFISVIAFLLYQFAYQSIKKRIYFLMSVIAFFCMLGTVAVAFHQFEEAQLDRPAIVFSPETTVKSEPNLRSEAVFTLHEGTKVQVMDTVSNWKKIRLIDGKIGWIVAEDIKEL